MAAGKGTRMKSALPKVLHRLGGRALLQHVLDTAAALGPARTVVVTGHGAAAVEAAAAPSRAVFVRQEPQLGTGHAVQQTVPALDDANATTLILNGDVPLIRAETCAALVAACGGRQLALCTIELPDPSGYGRIVREGAQVRAIVEHKDATPAQRAVREVYTGIMAAPTAALKRWVAALRNDNAQREYYLTDVVAMAVAEGLPVVASPAPDETEVLGVNSPAQLADLERRFQRRQAEALMEDGVRLADPARFDLRGTLACGRDVEIDVDAVFEGDVRLGDEVRIGPFCRVRNSTLAAGTQVHAHCDLDGVATHGACVIGPFARLRPGAELADGAQVGNFVEVKNATLGQDSKASHLSYLGDAAVGAGVNIGAGTITCNYDGANKHRTVIEDGAFIGSNTALVAPITVGKNATVGAGSTLSKNAPPGELTVSRAKQTTVRGWKRPTKS